MQLARSLAIFTEGETEVVKIVFNGKATPQRAADLVTSACARHQAIAATLAGWLDSMPADVTRRSRGGVSWHGAAWQRAAPVT